MSTNNPFNYVNAINLGIDLNVDTDYNAFITNRALSFYPDTLFVANEINLHSDLDPQMQFDFLRTMITPRKRFAKWPKPVKQRAASVLSKRYQISMSKAYQYQQFYTDEEIDQLEQEIQE